MGKPINKSGFSKACAMLQKGCWASSVSLWSAPLDRKEARALEAGALKQKAQIARWLGIPRCHASAASGGCQKSGLRQNMQLYAICRSEWHSPLLDMALGA